MASNKKRKHPGGRPTVMTKEVLAKLEEVFSMGGSDTEAAFYAGISVDALYGYQEKHPEYVKRKEALKERPILLARRTIIKSLDQTSNAQWYLERKRKAEFSSRTEITGEDGKELGIVMLPPKPQQ